MNEPEPEPDPAREGIDWVRTESGDVAHPLQHRCFESMMKFWKQTKDEELNPDAEGPVADFIFEWQTTSAKLAGALGGISRGMDYADPSFTVAYLKRALDHLHKSQAGLETAAEKKLMPEALIAEARKELFEIREEVLTLMDKYRGRRRAEDS